MLSVETRRMCPNCRAFVTTGDKVCPYCDVQIGPRAIDRRSPADVLGGLIPHARFTTVVILLINFGLYLAMALHAGNFMNFDLRTLYQFGGKVGPQFLEGQWWRFVTAGFLHGGLFHILMNSWVLFDLGAQTEESFGTSRYLVIYFFSTITGFYGSYLWSPGVSIGSSAGIFGLIGAMVALGVRDRSNYGRAVRNHYLQWGIYALLLSALFSSTDNAAHVGGFAGGFVIAFLAGTPRLVIGPTERTWNVLAGVAVALTAVSFAFMFRSIMAGNQF